MTETRGNRTAPTRRGAVSRFNDTTLEYVIGVARLYAILASLASVGTLLGLVWSGDLRWLWTLAALVVTSAAATVFGFFVHGNEEWFRAKTKR